jgi:uncharacterized protein (DUF1015 family)
MPQIKPFKAIRPPANKVHLVVSRAVESYEPNELKSEWSYNPFSFLRIIKPDLNQQGKFKHQSPEFLKIVKSQFESFCQRGWLEQEQNESLYLYEQTKNGKTFTGFIGLASAEDYENGKILIHEQTITDREEKLMHYLEICDFNAEPVLMFYPDHHEINHIIEQVKMQPSLYDFCTNDAVHHRVWRISNPSELKSITTHFSSIPSFYLADGHHRSASSVLLAKTRRARHQTDDYQQPYNYFLATFLAESSLHIYDYNRVVKDLNGLYENDFINLLSEKCRVKELNEEPSGEGRLHQLFMYLGGRWYALEIKEESIDNSSATGNLDAQLLTDLILSPILGIHDLKTDKRIGFVNGTKGKQELKSLVDSGKMKVAFALHPVELHQLKRVADEHCIMPPKSTYIEPKLRSGMLVYSLS